MCPFCAEETGQHDVRRAFGQDGEMGSESCCRAIDISGGHRGVHEVEDASQGAAMEISHWSGFGRCSGVGMQDEDQVRARVLFKGIPGRHSELQSHRLGPRAYKFSTQVNRWVTKWLQHMTVIDGNSLQSVGHTPRRPSGAVAALGKAPPSDRMSRVDIMPNICKNSERTARSLSSAV